MSLILKIKNIKTLRNQKLFNDFHLSRLKIFYQLQYKFKTIKNRLKGYSYPTINRRKI